MAEIKYTSDGRKVAIVGKLNNQETIVQEVFVTERGSEIPAGENFVVRSLLDEPAKSWQQNQKERIEREYNAAKKSLEDATRELENKTRAMQEYTRQKTSWMREIADNANRDWFELVYGIVNCEYTHFFVEDWGRIDLLQFDDAFRYQDGSKQNIKSFSLEKKWDASKQRYSAKPSLTVNRYFDGSGDASEMMPFRGYEAAVSYLQELAEKPDYIATDKRIVLFAKHGVTFPQHKLDALQAQKDADKAKRIAELQAQIEKLNQK